MVDNPNRDRKEEDWKVERGELKQRLPVEREVGYVDIEIPCNDAE
jgi:hypothetical protein